MGSRRAARAWLPRVLCIAASAAIATGAEGWEKLPPLPEPNGGFIVGEVEGKVVVLGGTNWRGGQKHFLTGVHVLDPVAMKWETRTPLPEPVAYAVSGTVGGRFTWAGGTDGQHGARRIGWLGGGLPAESLPAAVVLCAGGAIGGRLVFVGGTDDPANLAGLTRAAFALEPASGAVAKLPDFPGAPFGTAASAVLGERLFVFGGANWDAARATVANTAQAHALWLSARQWHRLAPLPHAVRGLSAVALDERRIYLAGGYKNDVEEFTDEAFLYDVEADRYTPAPPLPCRAMVGLVRCGGFVHCLGGEDRKQSRTAQCWRIRATALLPREGG